MPSQLSRIIDPKTGKPFRLRQKSPIRPLSRYDASVNSPESSRHWAAADDLSARSANSLEVRKVLRRKARYESANNSYCRGIVLTKSNDLVGCGPRPQVQTSRPRVNRAVEERFSQWMQAVMFACKLRTMAQAKIVDGEPFGVFTTNEKVQSAVQLDVALVECDQVTDPWWGFSDPDVVDGIRYDRYGNPVSYRVLKYHPGDDLWYGGSPTDSEVYPAWKVLHWFRSDRPGQCRGIPEITPALGLFAQLRRYTIAALDSAEKAACISGVLETESPPDVGDVPDTTESDNLETDEDMHFQVVRGMLMRLPDGAKLNAFKSEQPVDTYPAFKAEVIGEIARCLDMPYNKAAGNSSSYNYASGRLDHQTYFRALKVERSHCEQVVVGPTFRAWLDEAIMIPGYLPRGTNVVEVAENTRWFWDGWEHVDPAKEANASTTLLESHLLTFAEYYAAKGQDWEVQLRQKAREMELVRELGLEVEKRTPAERQQRLAEVEEEDEEEVATYE